MKKRLLALALCLVLATSLLPITAAAVDYHFNSASIVADGVEYRDTSSAQYPAYYVNITGLTLEHNTGTIVNTDGFITVSPICCSAEATDYLTDPPVAGVEYFPYISIYNDSLLPNSFEYDDDFFANLVIPGYETNFRDCVRSDSSAAITLRFRMVKHSWQFSQTDSTLTAKCRNSGCPIQTVGVTLAADSVTLPESPFNARLEGLKQFQQEVPDAVIGEFVYKYKGPGDTEYRVVQPTAANAKAGEYQVGVQISGLPGTVEQEGPVAMAYEGNQDNTGYADLYVQYTAADPAITAQTGDNRPIELMMASVLVFSALAAAAFVLDGQRKYRQ